MPAAKGAVLNFGVTEVQLQPGLLDFAEREAVHLIPGIFSVGAALALANVPETPM